MFDTDKFISYVHEKPALWDKSTKKYTDALCRERAWLEVGSKMFDNWLKLDSEEKDTKAKELKKKWRHIRDSYIKFANKRKKSGAAAKRIKYIYADALGFLAINLENSKRSGNITDSLDEEEGDKESGGNANDGEQDLNNMEPGSSKEPFKRRRALHRQSDMEIKEESHLQIDIEVKEERDTNIEENVHDGDREINNIEKERSHKPLKRRRGKQGQRNAKISQFQKELLKMLEQSLKKEKEEGEEDADKHFLMSLLPDLKKLSDQEKTKFKLMNIQFLDRSQQKHTQQSPAEPNYPQNEAPNTPYNFQNPSFMITTTYPPMPNFQK